MMNLRISALRALAAAAVLFVAGPAFAEDMLVIDIAKLFADTKAGKDVQKQMTALQDDLVNKSKIKDLGENFQAQRTKLEQAKQNLDSNLITQEAFQEELKKAMSQQQEFAQTRQALEQTMQVASAKAQYQFLRAVQPMLEKLVSDKSAKILLKRESVLYFTDAVDVTAEAIQRVDAKLDSLKVELVPEEGQN